MNRLNARILMTYNIAEATMQYIPIPMEGKLMVPDREAHAKAVRENHMYCDIADAIRRPGRRAD